MDNIEAQTFIATLKKQMPNKILLNELCEWCNVHEPIYNANGHFILFPLLRDKETKEVVCYMNQYGYQVSINGIPTHPIQDYLGITWYNMV